MRGLAIKDVADRTGIAAGTIRMWEQRYGFPRPERTASGYRRYSEEDVETLRRIIALRARGLSIPASIDRARENGTTSDRGSLYATIRADPRAPRPYVLRKSTLVRLSLAIEHETMARAAAPVLVGGFQHEHAYRRVEQRYRRLADQADAAAVFADFPAVRHDPGAPVELPLTDVDALEHEWALVVDAPGYAACLLAWEQPDPAGTADDGDPRYEAMWTLDPRITRRASETAARLAGRVDPAYGEHLEDLLADRPLAVEAPAAGLTALANRVIAYLDQHPPARG